MKTKILSVLLLFLICIFCLAGCQSSDTPKVDVDDTKEETGETVTEKKEFPDLASELSLDMQSNTLKQEVTVRSFVDGDTTHFDVPTDIVETGVLKARYLAVDTPESTGKIEEYGKAASRFTREKLSSATSIIIESDDGNWNLDSTGGRYLVWVWYRTGDSEPYRNLNLEILQNGLAVGSSTANNRYGDICMRALGQAKEQKLNVFSGEPDPDYYYGDAVELTLRELRCDVEQYAGMKVAFDAVVTKHSGNGVYVEHYDPETDRYYGMSIYYGFSLSDYGVSILSVGNEVRIVGTVSYYEAGDTYQISDLNYRAMKPDDPGNIQLISEGHAPAFVPTTADTLMNGEVAMEGEDGTKNFSYADLAIGTTASMENLYVDSVYTTDNEDSNSNGAMTLNCTADGIPVTVRTAVLRDENGDRITGDMYLGKTISVQGIVDKFQGEPQLRVLSKQDITIVEP